MEVHDRVLSENIPGCLEFGTTNLAFFSEIKSQLTGDGSERQEV